MSPFCCAFLFTRSTIILYRNEIIPFSDRFDFVWTDTIRYEIASKRLYPLRENMALKALSRYKNLLSAELKTDVRKRWKHTRQWKPGLIFKSLFATQIKLIFTTVITWLRHCLNKRILRGNQLSLRNKYHCKLVFTDNIKTCKVITIKNKSRNKGLFT